ncbi:MAG: metallophosphoesterase family protein [Planctomycetota bacterium]
MVKTAVISDIHGNLVALKAVLADIEKQGVDRIVCLGDIIGYGPEPTACLDLVRERCEFALMGNHDFAVLYEPTSFNTSAEQAAFWTRKQFEQEPDADKRRARWEYLGNLLIRRWDHGSLWVHASPRRPINEYIFPDDVVSAPNKMSQIFDRVRSRCYVGHTHQPGVFTDEPDFYPPGDLGGAYTFLENEKCIINPGSVGQPRDRDPRASYAVLEEPNGEAVEGEAETGDGEGPRARVVFHRVEYDIETVVAHVAEINELSDFLGQRLLEGR